MSIAVEASGVGKMFYMRTRKEKTLSRRAMSWFWPAIQENPIWAVRGANLSIQKGEVLGIIGLNGAGKTTLLSLLAGLLSPTEGRVRRHGRVSSFMGLGSAMYGDLPVIDNIRLAGTIFGMTRSEIEGKMDEIIEFGGFGRYRYAFLSQLSSGYQGRVVMSTAFHSPVDILFVDEGFATGDALFVEKCLGKMDALLRAGKTVILSSHAMEMVKNYCTRVIELEGGRVVNDGPAADVVAEFMSKHGIK